MKKSLRNLLASTFLFSGSVTAQPYLDQYFDGGDSLFYTTTTYNFSLLVRIDTSQPNNIWEVGDPSKVIFDSAASLPNVIVTDLDSTYPIGNTSSFSFIVNPYSWGSNYILGLQWKQKLDMEHNEDGGIVEFSIDYGATWQNAFNNPYVYNYFGFDASNQDTLNSGDYALSGTDSTWRDIWLCYDMMWLMGTCDSIQIRFTFKSDSTSNSREGWMIDNLHAHITFGHPVKEQKMDKYVSVYPNPATERINIQLQPVNGYHIIEKLELYTIEGKLADRWDCVPTRFWIDTKKYQPGNYILKIRSNLKQETIPVIIQR